MVLQLTFRQRLTYWVHMCKALTKRHHRPTRPLLRRLIKPDAVIFDIGANAGNFTHIFSNLAPQGHVYAFEPGSYALSILRRVIPARCRNNVTLIEHGLSDKEETLELHLPVKKSGSLGHGIGHIGKDYNDARATVCEHIPLRRLDDVAHELKIDRLDFIKIDVEGWETHALRGGEKTIARFKPVIMMEMSERFLQRAGSSRKELIDFLQGHGYTLYNQRYAEITRVPEQTLKGDVLAVPSDVVFGC
jgi:FkbM family methyltransferase